MSELKSVKKYNALCKALCYSNTRFIINNLIRLQHNLKRRGTVLSLSLSHSLNHSKLRSIDIVCLNEIHAVSMSISILFEMSCAVR